MFVTFVSDTVSESVPLLTLSRTACSTTRYFSPLLT